MWNARAEHLPNIPRNLAVLGAYLAMPEYMQLSQTLDGNDYLYAGTCGLFAHGTLSVVFISRRMMAVLQRQRKVCIVCPVIILCEMALECVIVYL